MRKLIFHHAELRDVLEGKGTITCPNPQCERENYITVEPVFISRVMTTDSRKYQYICMCGYKTKKSRRVAKVRRMVQNG